MLDIFSGLKNILKVNREDIDGSIFRLHYNFTAVCLLACSVILTTKQNVGDPIDCAHSSKDIKESVLNTYCWIHSTFIVQTAFDPNKYGDGKIKPYPGIDNSSDRKEWRLQKYYQWVCFVLFFQAILFYSPRWLWKRWEGGKIKALSMNLRLAICTDCSKKEQKEILLEYLWNNMGNHKFWAFRYFFCEFLCFTNVIGQIFFMDRFLEGEFLTFGTKVVEFMQSDQENRTDPMVYVFPRITKCNFWYYGSSGEINNISALCVLPLNIVNEKIYIFLWFWFIILSLLTGFQLVSRVLLLIYPSFRLTIFHIRFRTISRKQLKILLDTFNIGDWLLFYLLGQNIDSVIFRDTISDILENINNNGKVETV